MTQTDSDETWREVRGLLVSRLGNVALPGGGSVSHYVRRGHRCVALPGGSESRLDRLVAEAFLRKPKRIETVRHLNGDPADCRADNLLIVNTRSPARIDLLRAAQLRQDGVSRATVFKLTGVSRDPLRAVEGTETHDP